MYNGEDSDSGDSLIFTSEITRFSPAVPKRQCNEISDLSTQRSQIDFMKTLDVNHIIAVIDRLVNHNPVLLSKVRCLLERKWLKIRDNPDDLATASASSLDLRSIKDLGLGKLPLSINFEQVGKVLFCAINPLPKVEGQIKGFSFAAVQIVKHERRETELMYATVSMERGYMPTKSVTLKLFHDLLHLLSTQVQYMIMYFQKERDFLLQKCHGAKIPNVLSLGQQLLATTNFDQKLVPKIEDLFCATFPPGENGHADYIREHFRRYHNYEHEDEVKRNTRLVLMNARALFFFYDQMRGKINIGF